jgi:ribonuclease HepT-like protein
MTTESALAARIRAEVSELERLVERTERLLAKSARDEDYLDGVALCLHGFYSGAERIFEAIAREIDGAVPRGPDWHRDLLIQVSADVAGSRPAAISRDSRACLDSYRGFRHIVRNVYAFSLREERVRELGSGLRACFAALSRDLDALCAFLERQAP